MVKLAEKYLSASSTFNVAQEWVSWAKGQSLQGLQLALGLRLREREILEACITKGLLKGGVGWKKEVSLWRLHSGLVWSLWFQTCPLYVVRVRFMISSRKETKSRASVGVGLEEVSWRQIVLFSAILQLKLYVLSLSPSSSNTTQIKEF